jgi:5-methylcytosine-specific restriction endonuclease McrA
MELIEKLHLGNIQCAKDYLQRESELIDRLQAFDDRKGYRYYDCTSLYQYAVKCLKLSESKSLELISIARKSKEVPELKEAISQGTINTSQARRIVSVITPENQAAWIEQASVLPQRELEKKIVEHNPREAVKDRMTYVQPTRVKLECGISEELMREIERVKDLVSQRSGQPASLENALKAMTTLYLEKKDPVEKAKRMLSHKETLSSRRVALTNPAGKRTAIPSLVKHEVIQRDNGQCIFTDTEGKRCENKKWIDLHHKTAIADGGEHSAANIVTVCRPHHSLHHQLTL